MTIWLLYLLGEILGSCQAIALNKILSFFNLEISYTISVIAGAIIGNISYFWTQKTFSSSKVGSVKFSNDLSSINNFLFTMEQQKYTLFLTLLFYGLYYAYTFFITGKM